MNTNFYGKVIYDEDDKVVCGICNKSYKKLLSHVLQTHKLTGNEYREMFGLDKGVGLIAKDTKKRLQEAVKKNYDTVITENLINKGKNTRLKKGYTGRTKDMIREQTRQRLIKNLSKDK